MGSANRDNYVCVRCGCWYGHKGKCDHCGHFLKADRLLSEEDSEQLMELAKASKSVITSPGTVQI
jgi:predicted ATP-dependent serine protease